jgi:hypothetical protein
MNHPLLPKVVLFPLFRSPSLGHSWLVASVPESLYLRALLFAHLEFILSTDHYYNTTTL